MKNIYLLLLIFSIQIVSGQEEEDLCKIIHSERNAAAKMMNVTQNVNTQNYNVTYHELRLTVDPAVYYISGVVKTTFQALSPMNTVTFDMATALAVSSVTLNNAPLVYAQSNYELVITLPSTLATGNSATVVITYAGVPPSGEAAFTIGTHPATNGTPVLYTLSEPYGARDWWPCKQDMNDKVESIDVYITAPSQYVSVSNGLEVSQTTNGSSKTTHYHHGYPIPAYLIAIAVTNYQIYNQQGGLGTTASPYFPIVNYLYPESATSSITSLAPTPSIINFYESKFGNYPFRAEKYGHAQFGWGGGMEHTTVSFMGGFSRSLIAHEMGHQWFGDKITCGTWKDIWLNEGITEYLSGLVVEYLDGNTSFISWKSGKITSITSALNGAVYLTDAEALDVNRIFSSRLTYNKGSMVVNMLRYKMGDTAFFQAMNNYLTDPNLAYNYAITPQFKAHLETVYGSSLTEFFNDWVYNQGYPTYTVVAENLSSSQTKITINQTQSHNSVNFFEMPVPIRLTGAGGQVFNTKLEHTSNGQQFIVNTPFTVTGVSFDPEKNIISKNSTATLAASPFELEGSIYLYPNPAEETIEVQLPAYVDLQQLTLYNIMGQKVLESKSSQVGISELSSGSYFVTIETTSGIFYKKLIKK